MWSSVRPTADRVRVRRKAAHQRRREGAPKGGRRTATERSGLQTLGRQRSFGLVDVVAYLGPVFSAVFIIRAPGTSAPRAGGHRGVRARLVVAQYAKRIHAARVATTTCRASARWLARRPATSTAGTIILTIGVLIGGYVHDNLMPVVFSVEDGRADLIFALGSFVVLYFGVQIDARTADAGAGFGRRCAHVLPVDYRPAGRRQRLREGVDPTRPRTVHGIMFGVLYGVLIECSRRRRTWPRRPPELKKSIPRAVLLCRLLWRSSTSSLPTSRLPGLENRYVVITSPGCGRCPRRRLGVPEGSSAWTSSSTARRRLPGPCSRSTCDALVAMARDRRLPKMRWRRTSPTPSRS